jgi:hypothetical protein
VILAIITRNPNPKVELAYEGQVEAFTLKNVGSQNSMSPRNREAAYKVALARKEGKSYILIINPDEDPFQRPWYEWPKMVDKRVRVFIDAVVILYPNTTFARAKKWAEVRKRRHVSAQKNRERKQQEAAHQR